MLSIVFGIKHFLHLDSDLKIAIRNMGIVDEIISHSQGQTSYKARVKSFIKKMNSWTPGRVICLKSFSVDGVKLRMKVYPNGINEDCENHVSMVIENVNDFKIRLKCDFSIGYKEEYKDIMLDFDPDSLQGFPNFYHHSGNHSNLLRSQFPFPDTDKDFEITLTVKRVWKEFVDEEIDSHNPVIQSISTLKIQ